MTFFRSMDKKLHCNDRYQYKMPLNDAYCTIKHRIAAILWRFNKVKVGQAWPMTRTLIRQLLTGQPFSLKVALTGQIQQRHHR